MGLLGKILATPIKIINVPAKVFGKLVHDEEDILAKPLDCLAETLEEIDE